tara:strand:+ start:378 stop:1091 length:714 start_codon:yes stop_codon:yes gene_type:complete
MTRELVLDTETTGLDYGDGHRLVEIGIVELKNHVQTGNYFHYYLNPERDSDKRAEEIHGLTRKFLSDKPKFSEIAEEFVEFISNSKIIIHNASFDVGFLNAELNRCNMKKLNEDTIIDTLVLAKNIFLGQSVSLDSLCRKYNISLTGREIHGALKDAKLLASVYLELIGGRQSKLEFENTTTKFDIMEEMKTFDLSDYYKNRPIRTINHTDLDPEEYKMHLKSINNIENCIWKKYQT